MMGGTPNMTGTTSDAAPNGFSPWQGAQAQNIPGMSMLASAIHNNPLAALQNNPQMQAIMSRLQQGPPAGRLPVATGMQPFSPMGSMLQPTQSGMNMIQNGIGSMPVGGMPWPPRRS